MAKPRLRVGGVTCKLGECASAKGSGERQRGLPAWGRGFAQDGPPARQGLPRMRRKEVGKGNARGSPSQLHHFRTGEFGYHFGAHLNQKQL
jgi:hypothetical protein